MPRKKQKLMNGLRIEVKNNNVEFALKKFKRMIKDSELMVELRDRTYYEKPSRIKREKKNLQKARQRYKNIKNKRDF
tara:strand:+ start:643 stop:873 length:231 start_codon:yes stop_codon:yes gene_type:complete